MPPCAVANIFVDCKYSSSFRTHVSYAHFSLEYWTWLRGRRRTRTRRTEEEEEEEDGVK